MTDKETRGIEIVRAFTEDGVDPLDAVEWTRTDVKIWNRDGTIQFEMKGVEAPADWSEQAVTIAASKYLKRVSAIDSGKGETSVRALIKRVADTLAEEGRKQGYLKTAEVTKVFRDELAHLLVNQVVSFNSPVWFNCGLSEKYGMTGDDSHNFAWDAKKGQPISTKDYFSRPQLSACFIQSIEDDLNDIWDHVAREGRIFKGGSGTGSNFSSLRSRGERLSTGGTSSGVLSFLEVFDKVAGSTKSGGTNRRAAKMVILNADHPEIEAFIDWKMREEEKAKVLVAAGFSSGMDGEAYRTVSGQNSNNSVRVTDEFMQAVVGDREWDLKSITNGETVRTIRAKDLFERICTAAWHCADPGLQYDTTINEWNTVPKSGRMNASNPCVPGDTLVATDVGWRRIADMVGETAMVVGSDGQYHHVRDIFPTGTKDVISITTMAGYTLSLTADHKVLTANRGDVPASNLETGDIIVLAGGGFGHETMNPDIAFSIGLMVGDGCVSRDGVASLTMGKHEGDIVQLVADTLSDVKMELRPFGTSGPNAAPVPHETSTSMKITAGSTSVVEYLQRWAVLDRLSPSKVFTDDIHRLDKSSLSMVLRGLFTADGIVENSGDKSQCVGLDSTSLPLLRQVQRILLSFGIKAKIYPNRNGDTHEKQMPDGHGGVKLYPVQDWYSLRITRSSRVAFEREIGFHPLSYKAIALRKMNESVGVYADRMTDEIVVVSGVIDTVPVYDLTEMDTHHFVANGIVVHNCGEYHFLDDSSCNLSSINLTKFLSDGRFDIQAFKHVCELLIIAQDIIVDYASYPTSAICENTHNFRALGLGYCNLGSLVMRMGFPYDSEESRAVAAAITSIMTGAAYATSARLAAAMGPFDAYQKNRAAMVKVVEKHRSKAAGIQQKMCPEYMLDASQEAWEEARDLGKTHGFRNAQVTLLAPTGTISFTMDADTTGIEPAYALVAFKTYAGGGYAKLAIDSVVPALEMLGYHEAAIEDIRRYIVGHGSIRQNGSQDGVNVVRLKQIGFTDEVLAKVNSRIPNSPDLDSAIEAVPEAKVLIDSFLERGGFDAVDHVGERPLKMLGFSDDEVREANEYCCGHMTVQGAPHIKPQHLPVFDCASSPGADGTGTILPSGHLGMMSAVQPFLSGAISKTVNLSNSATVSDIGDVYLEAWNRGLKCITIYRDGCKTDQPLSVKQKAKKAVPTDGRPRRQEPPTFMDTGGRRKVQIDKYTLYVHAYRNPKTKKVNEVWVNVKPGGGPLAGMMDVTCRLISILLQYGVPLEELVKKFAFTSFEPAGLTTHPKIPTCRSIADLIFRTLAIDFLGDESYAGKVGDDAVLAIEEITDSVSSYDGGTTAAMANGDDCCPNCGSSDLKPTGNCKACIHCGTSLGCS